MLRDHELIRVSCCFPSQDEIGSWAKAGNRLVYTVDVAKAGRYRPVLDAANRGREPGAKRLHLTCRQTGQQVSFAVTATGSNTDWIGFATDTLDLPAGRVQIELYCEDGDINIDTIRFDAQGVISAKILCWH